MADDWIKMRVNLADDPKVDHLTDLIGLDEFAIVGRLHHLWGKVGDYSEDGIGVNWSHSKLDKMVRCDGFADALSKVGWLTGESRNLTFPNFSEHNGQTAKRRAQTAKRNARLRSRDATVTQPALQERHLEKRREEKRRGKEEEGAAPRAAAVPVRWDSSSGFSVCERRREGWVSAYPLVDIDREIAKAHAWYTDNPNRRAKNHARFLGSWMRRTQEGIESGRNQSSKQSHASRAESYNHPEDNPLGGVA